MKMKTSQNDHFDFLVLNNEFQLLKYNYSVILDYDTSVVH